MGTKYAKTANAASIFGEDVSGANLSLIKKNKNIQLPAVNKKYVLSKINEIALLIFIDYSFDQLIEFFFVFAMHLDCVKREFI